MSSQRFVGFTPGPKEGRLFEIPPGESVMLSTANRHEFVVRAKLLSAKKFAQAGLLSRNRTNSHSHWHSHSHLRFFLKEELSTAYVCPAH